MCKTIKIKGSSGVNIYFYKNRKGVQIVRKETVKKEQIYRLKIQYEKHIFLSKYKNDLFKIPEVINRGFRNGNFFYEYIYIYGNSLSQNLFTKSVKELTKTIDQLAAITEYFSKKNKYFEKEFKNKGFKSSLKEKILTVSSSLNLEQKFQKKLLDNFEKIKFPILKTLHHGDLSFENIIIDKEKKIWLIDYIGTSYPHYWWDLAKMFQDIEGGWSYIKYGIKLDEKKAKYFTEYLKNNISFFDKEYLKYHNFLMAIIFLRILPYLKSKSKRTLVLKKINDYLNLW